MSTFESEIWSNGLTKNTTKAVSVKSGKTGHGGKVYSIIEGANSFFGRSRRYNSDSEYGSDSDISESTSLSRHSSSKLTTAPTAPNPSSNNGFFKKHRIGSNDSDSESEIESGGSPKKKLSFGGFLGRKSVPNAIPARAPSTHSDSDSELEHSANSNGNIFKNIMQPASSTSKQSHPPLPHSPTNAPRLDSSLHSASNSMSTLSISSRSNSETSLSEKYGETSKSELGRGATAVVRLCTSTTGDNKKYAIKEFKAKRKGEDQKSYIKKLTSEFNISSSLVHENVVRTVDLIQDDRKKWCVVMEYSEGGDLFSKIQAGLLTDPDLVDCFFKQLVKGVAYLHGQGVAHRDLKPENLLLDASCRILKITDFGVSTVFHLPLETQTNKSMGECGSGPYIAPEVFLGKPYDPEFLDIWSIGIIYYVMTYMSIPWMESRLSDSRYKRYFDQFGVFGPIERFPPLKRQLMYRMLNPDVTKRFNIKKVLESEWVQRISACRVGMPAEAVMHSHNCLLKNGRV
ncbi:UNVERIFIED_CONTAM: serine/threonine-protein kinase HAL4/sat4 [Siphonaria sp. JEL0065]|nr:serine/threonine-protein kinase HAL4/sat4 [Siphonaria sp. JEL0065]